MQCLSTRFYFVYCSPGPCSRNQPHVAHVLQSLARISCSFPINSVFFPPNTTKILDVFIVLDESGSVTEENYHKMIEFVKSFVEDLDNSV